MWQSSSTLTPSPSSSPQSCGSHAQWHAGHHLTVPAAAPGQTSHTPPGPETLVLQTYPVENTGLEI